jgi:hypothetical protein
MKNTPHIYCYLSDKLKGREISRTRGTNGAEQTRIEGFDGES